MPTYPLARSPLTSLAALLTLAVASVSTGLAAATIWEFAAPAAPSDVTAEDLGSGVAGVTWSDNSTDEDGFEVQRESQKGNGDWFKATTVATTAPDVTSVDDEAGTGTYRYRVRAFNGSGESAWSPWAEVTLADGGGGSSELTWTESGVTWGDDQPGGTWEQMNDAVANWEEGGFSDWRLPTPEEAQAAVLDGSWGTRGTGGGSLGYWTSKRRGNWAWAYFVSFETGVPLAESYELRRVWWPTSGLDAKAVRP